MKKLIITILAIATMAIAANKPVCNETNDSDWQAKFFTCVRPTTDVKKVVIIIATHSNFLYVSKKMNDGTTEGVSVSFDEENDLTVVTENTLDDLNVLTNRTERLLDGDQFSFFYEQLRDEYDLRRKN